MSQPEPLTEIQEEEGVPARRRPLSYPPPAQSPTFDLDERARKRRSGSSITSRVDLDYFDRDGVARLERSLSRMSRHSPPGLEPSIASRVASIACPSDETINFDESFDYAKTLRQISRRMQEANIESRELGVVFENLQVVGLGASSAHLETLGSVLNPLNWVGNFQDVRHPSLRQILSGFEGVVRPGEMLLVLGSPGSGCSTFLKTLANHRQEYHSVSGEVHYDSISPEDLYKHYRGDVQYCPEDDITFPSLTVEQTLSFAAKTRAPQSRPNQSRPEFINMLTEILVTIFGLSHVKKTPVGDAAIRGVSGGQKKRVSIAETLATRSRITAWDNSTRGLDASTALEFGRALRIATDISRVTTIVSIYQASEQLYELFDKVCVIYEGKMAYFGDARKARDYFIEMGYEPANRQTTPDFLVAVTDPKARIPRPGMLNQPRTAEDFARYFLKSPMGEANKEEIALYKHENVGLPEKAHAYKRSVLAEQSKTTRKSSAYLISIPMQARAVMKRRVQIMWGNKAVTIANLVVFIIQGVIIGTIFLKLPEDTATFYSRGGVLFFVLLFCALNSLAEIPSLYQQRPIVLRHQKAALYHPAIEAVALTLVDIPITFLLTLVFGVIIYFLVRLQQTAGQFFTFYLFLFTMTLTMKAWFRAVAASFKSEATAQAVAGISLLILMLYTGYTIPKPTMIGALRWLTWINPVRYGFEGVLSNEFHTLDVPCSSIVPSGPGYEGVSLDNQVCTVIGAIPGQAFVDGNRYIELAYGYSHSNLWRNFGIAIAFGVAFIAALIFFTERNTSFSIVTSRVLFKRGSKRGSSTTVTNNSSDLEKKHSVAPSDSTRIHEIAVETTVRRPFQTDIFSWQHIKYTVPTADGPRQLLDDVSGFVVPGKLTALMGESGAGKTTLLNVLAERTDVGVVTGDRFVNGHTLPIDFQAQTGYCQQTDTHVPTDTVREAILISAKLRQPPSVPLAEKEAYVNTCLKMCGLEAYADASVGSLNIEFRKRTTIAVELAAKPKLLLFLDEPTSGLDSQSAWAIVTFLRSLADNGQAILCTIHQPSAELFQVFDRLLLLRKGGQTVFFGDIGHNATTLIKYFERNGSRVCEPGENPAEWMLDVIGAGATATTSQDWYDIWRKSPESKGLQSQLEKIHAEGRARPPVQATLQSEFATPWLNQFSILIKRDMLFRWRNPTYLTAKLILNITGGLLIGFTFWRAKDTQQGTQNKLFAVFMGLIISVPVANQLQVPFLNMRNVYEIRERPSRMYHWSALITAQFLAEIPWNMLGSSLFFFCWYWTVGFLSSRAAYTFLIFSVIFPFYYTSFAQSVAAIAPNAELAALLFTFLFSFVLNFNGVLQPFIRLGWWQWMYRLSPYTYIIEGLLGQAIGRQSITCSSVELATINPPSGQTCGEYMRQYISTSGGYLTNPDDSSNCQFCSTATTDQYLGASFNIEYAHRWRNVGIVCGFIVFNIFMIYAWTYVFRIKKGKLFSRAK